MITKTVDSDGDTWYRNEHGELHREGDEPAIIFKTGIVNYCKNGQDHRLAGPAWIWPNGRIRYCIYGADYTKEQFEKHPLVREYRLKQTIEDLLK